MKRDREIERTGKQAPCSAFGTLPVRYRTTLPYHYRYATVYATVGGRKKALSRYPCTYRRKPAQSEALDNRGRGGLDGLGL